LAFSNTPLELRIHPRIVQVTIAKYFSHPSTPDYAVAQDLSAKSDSLTVKSGDSLEVKYTGWLVNGDGTIGATFDSNHGTDKTFRFKSGKNKVIKVYWRFSSFRTWTSVVLQSTTVKTPNFEKYTCFRQGELPICVRTVLFTFVTC